MFFTSDHMVTNSRITDNEDAFPAGGLSNFDQFGASLAAIGDVDNNGSEDFMVGAFFNESVYLVTTNVGGKNVYTRITNGLLGFSHPGFGSPAFFGSSVTALGDIDGDRYTDFFVGAGREDNGDVNEGG